MQRPQGRTETLVFERQQKGLEGNRSRWRGDGSHHTGSQRLKPVVQIIIFFCILSGQGDLMLLDLTLAMTNIPRVRSRSREALGKQSPGET